MEVPPVSERGHTIEESPLQIDLHARSRAIRLLEHAVSTVALGPVRLKNQLTLLDSIFIPVPVE